MTLRISKSVMSKGSRGQLAMNQNYCNYQNYYAIEVSDAPTYVFTVRFSLFVKYLGTLFLP